MLNLALDHNGPASMRYPKANLEKVERILAPMELGKAEVWDWGEDAMIVAFGMVLIMAGPGRNKVRAGESILLVLAGFALARGGVYFLNPRGAWP